mgnify:CR=1 FL=1
MEIDQHTLLNLGVNEEDVLNIYIVGSHLWQTAHHKSDYDLLIITQDSNPTKQQQQQSKAISHGKTKGKGKGKEESSSNNKRGSSNQITQGIKGSHWARYDARVVPYSHFIDLFMELEMDIIITCWIPPSHIVKQSFLPLNLLTSIESLDQVKLVRGVLERSEKDWDKAEKFHSKGKLIEGTKILLHGIRNHLLVLQIQEFGKVKDFDILTRYLESRELDIKLLTYGPSLCEIFQQTKIEMKKACGL